MRKAEKDGVSVVHGNLPPGNVVLPEQMHWQERAMGESVKWIEAVLYVTTCCNLADTIGETCDELIHGQADRKIGSAKYA